MLEIIFLLLEIILILILLIVVFHLGMGWAKMNIKWDLEKQNRSVVDYGDFNNRQGIIVGKWIQVK